MAVLGVSCDWGGKRISYAILEGVKNNPQRIEVDDYVLSEDVNITSLDQLKEVGKKMYDLCNIYTIEKACIFVPSGWEKPRRRPGWRPPDPMKLRIETAAVVSLQRSGVNNIEIKDTERIASDLGLSRGSLLRERIQDKVENKLLVANDSQRDAVAAALSILD